MSRTITVLKRNPAGEVTWQYRARLLRREPNALVLEARFNRPDLPFMGTVFKRNDRFVETFFTDSWYNIFEIHDRDDGGLKGWYCNIGRPAVLDGATLSYVDLALDLWVDPDGRQTLLDEDEFAALELDPETRRQALAGLEQLKQYFESKRPPS